mmetsp:Transcript_6504/g.10304  ORF Transcript_6504/g.10304 Transcript_6504/m.10304 type:complete len:96 (-) Transcript_6504:284-571(-)|eukprot:CAMPEP_0202685110 /NCGR_PEP_ID=MMETSP1385-20130828/792_1 /ASSEMBLY_ACC=CAM_ASM_000861 /TAXON_ID=933848 /ORGANISM="Elphidium margaritaceum" /LENGTH=95 /DNA_ID=CAMNT_0049339373 /DNA_START=97 /DNA_END=384 /DNA_ORIENTATION=+
MNVAAAKKLTMEDCLKVHEAFRSLLLSRLLKDTLAEITEHKKDRDEAQTDRLNLALKILGCKEVPLPAYPDKTFESLQVQMKKQIEKINKKKDKK